MSTRSTTSSRLELGGSNSVRNLFPESFKTQPLNAHVKDSLENKLHALACAGKITMQEAQQAIASNWTAAYVKYVGPLPGGAQVIGSTAPTVKVPVLPTPSPGPGAEHRAGQRQRQRLSHAQRGRQLPQHSTDQGQQDRAFTICQPATAITSAPRPKLLCECGGGAGGGLPGDQVSEHSDDRDQARRQQRHGRASKTSSS